MMHLIKVLAILSLAGCSGGNKTLHPTSRPKLSQSIDIDASRKKYNTQQENELQQLRALQSSFGVGNTGVPGVNNPGNNNGNQNPAGAGPYTGVTVAGPSGNQQTGDGGLTGSNQFVLQGSSGMIITGNANVEVEAPIQLGLMRVPTRPNETVRTQIVTKVKTILEKYLDEGFKVLDVLYDGILVCRRRRLGRELGSGEGEETSRKLQGSSWSQGQANWQAQQASHQANQQAWLNQQQQLQNQQMQNGAGTGTDWFNNGRDTNSQGNNNWGNNNNNGFGVNNGLGASGNGFGVNPNGLGANVCFNGPNSYALPLRVKLEAPSNLADYSATYIEQAIRRGIQELKTWLQSQNIEVFREVDITLGIYDPADIVESTPEPTPEPTTLPPTTLPPTTLPPEEELTVPLTINLDDIMPGYTPSEEDQCAILGMLRDIMAERLQAQGNLEVQNVAFPPETGTDCPPTRRLEGISLDGSRAKNKFDSIPRALTSQNALYLPVEITVSGPSGEIEVAYEQILTIAEESKEEFQQKLKEYVDGTFDNAKVSSEAGDVSLDSSTVITSHPIQFIFKQTKQGYELSERNRDSFINHVKQVMKANLGNAYDLVQVAYAPRFELDTNIPHLPVRVTVQGPSTHTNAKALQYVLNFLRGHKQSLTTHLKGLDRAAFNNMVMSIESNDKPDITVPTFVTEHEVWFGIGETPRGYELKTNTRNQIINYLKTLISDNISQFDPDLSLVDIVYIEKAGSSGRTLSMPLLVTVRGPAEISKRTEEFIKKIMTNFDLDIRQFLQKLDPNAFDGSNPIYFETDDSVIRDEILIQKEETKHPVQLIFQNVPGGYKLSATNKEKIKTELENLLHENLGEYNCDLVDITSRNDVTGPPLPFIISVDCPQESSSFALSYVLDTINDKKDDLTMSIKGFDWNNLKNVFVEVDTYDPASLVVTPEVILEESVHPIRLVFDNIPTSYRLSAANKASVIRFVKELLDDHLDASLEVVSVTSANDNAYGPPLPLFIRVKGDREKKAYALPHIMRALEEQSEKLSLFIKSLDWNELKEVIVTAESFDPNAFTVVPEDPQVVMKQSVHPLKLEFSNVPASYHLSAANEASILLFVKELLDDNLDGSSLELISVSQASGDDGSPISLQSEKFALPFWVEVKGPANDADFHLIHVIDALKTHKTELARIVESLDYNTFKNSQVEVDTWDFDDIVDDGGRRERTTHNVRLKLDGLSDGYHLSPEDRSSAIRFLKELIEANLRPSFTLIAIIDASKYGNYRNRNLHPSRRLDEISLPLRVTVEGPAKESDLALSYLMSVIDDHREKIEKFFKGRDWDSFKNIDLEIETFEFLASTLPLSESLQETTHKVMLHLENLPDESSISLSDKASIVGFVNELLDQNLKGGFELIEIVDASRDDRPPNLASDIDLPFEITLKGPSKDSDLALAYVFDVFTEHTDSIANELRKLDWDTFTDVMVSVSTWDQLSDKQEIEETIHPVLINIDNLPDGYKLSPSIKASLLVFTQELLEDELDESMGDISVSPASRLLKRDLSSPLPHQHRRRLGSVLIPLNVAVNGPADQADEAKAQVLDVLDDEENKEAMRKFLQSLDPTFKDAEISVSSYDPFALQESWQAVQLNIRNVQDGYIPSKSVLQSILGFLQKLLKNSIDESHELVRVTYAGSNERRNLSSSIQQHHRRLDTLCLPLHITMNSPANQVDDVASHIMETLQDHAIEIIVFLKTINAKAFSDANIGVAMYDLSVVEKSIHPIKLIFEDTPSDTILSTNERNSLISFVRKSIESSLDHAFDITDVSFAGPSLRGLRGAGDNRRFLQDAPTLPLLVNMEGREDASDLGLVYLLEAMNYNARNIANYLRTLDKETFKDTRVRVEPYDYVAEPSTATSLAEEDSKTPWWVWLLVVVLAMILLLCCCCICFYGYLYKKRKVRDNKESREVEVKEVKEETVTPNNVTTLFPLEQAPVVHHQIVPYETLQMESPQPERIVLEQPSIVTEESSGSSNENVFVIMPEETSSTASVVQSIVTYNGGADPPSHDPELLALPPHLPEEPLQLCDENAGTFSVISVDTESVLPTRALTLEPDSLQVESTISHCSHSHQPHHNREPGGVYNLEDVQSYSTGSSYTEPAPMARDPSAAMVLYGGDESISHHSQLQSSKFSPHPYAIQDSGEEACTWEQEASSSSSYSTQPPLDLSIRTDHRPTSHSSRSHHSSSVGVHSSAGREAKRSSKKAKKHHHESKKKHQRRATEHQRSTAISTSAQQQNVDDFYYGHSSTFYI